MKLSAYNKIQKRLLTGIVFLVLLIVATMSFGFLWISSVSFNLDTLPVVVHDVTVPEVEPVLTTDEKRQILQQLADFDSQKNTDQQMQKNILSTLKTTIPNGTGGKIPNENITDLQVN